MSLTRDEILATPESLKATDAYIRAHADAYENLAARHDRVVFLGCGSSYCLAQSAARMTMTRRRRPAMAVAAGDALLHAADYAGAFDNALVVTISRSGSTSEVVYALEKMKTLARFGVASINCVADSPLSRLGDLALDMPWAFDASVCQTRCVTSMFYALALLTCLPGGDPAVPASLAAAADALPGFIRDNEETARRIAAMPWTNAVVLADAEIDGLSQEGALAYKEICQIPGVFHNLLDARHGPMVMFGKETLIVAALAAGGEFESKFIRDVLAKGCSVVVLSDRPAGIDGVVNVVAGDMGTHIARGLPFILLNQLVSLAKSSFTGANPDKPDGLDPWIKL